MLNTPENNVHSYVDVQARAENVSTNEQKLLSCFNAFLNETERNALAFDVCLNFSMMYTHSSVSGLFSDIGITDILQGSDHAALS